MNATQGMRTIKAVKAKAPATLAVKWSDGTQAKIDLSSAMRERPFRSLRNVAKFSRVGVGEWGHSIEWPGGPELGADSLWLETLTAAGHHDAREFLEWRLRHGLSLTKAAEALEISRRMVAYYSSGERPVPRSILLACKGWETEQAA